MAQEMDRLEIVIEAQARQAASELDHLYQSLEKVSGSLSRISAKNALSGLVNMAKSAASGVASGAKQIASHFSLIGSSSSKIRTATSSLKGLLGAVIGFYGIRSLINLGRDAMELSSDLTEVQNVVENAFGPAGTEAVENFTETSIQRFGLAELAAKRISSRFQAMGKSMGITGQMIAEANERVGKSMDDMYDGSTNDLSGMSLNITKLAADMASFYNVSQEDAAQALSTIWTGQTRPLRQFGLDITQATLAEWAMKHGIDADIQSMTQAQKTMLRYQYVMSQTQMVQGDFNRTAFTWANQTRILRQQFEMLGKTIGDVLINIFRPLITWLNQAMAKVISFAETVANALGKIFGWTIIHTPAATTASDDFVDSLGDIGDAGKDAADGTGKATKALKEYENTVLGFDELNKLNPIPEDTSSPSGGSGSGSPSSSGSTASAAGADFQLVRTDNLIEKYKSDIQTLFGLGNYIGGVLSDEMEKINWQSVYEKARGFGTGLASFLNGLISPRLFSNLGITIAGAVNTVLNAKDAFLDRFNFTNLGRSLAAGINSFFETWDAGLQAQTFYKAVNGIVEAIRVAVTDIKWESIGNKISDCVRMALRGINWMNAYAGADKVGEGLAKYMNGLFKADTFKEVGNAVAKSLNTSLRTLSAWASNFKWDSFGRSLGAGLRKFIREFDWNLAASTFSKLANGILTSIKEAVSSVSWTTLGLKIRTALLNIEWGNLLQSVGSAIISAINAALDFAKGLFDGTPVETLITGLQEKLNGIAEKIDLPAIANGIKGIVDALTPAAEGFAKGFTDALGVFADIGGAALLLIGAGLKAISAAISDMDPAAVEAIGKALGVVAGAMSAITISKAAVGILGSIIQKLTGVTTASNVATDAVTGAGAGAASGGLAGAFAWLKTKAAAAATVLVEGGGYIPAVVAAGRMTAGFVEVLQGGNGKLSEYAGITRDVAGQLNIAKKLTNDQSEAIYQLGEDYENGRITAEDFGTKVETVFRDAGISASDLDLALAILGGNGFQITTSQGELMRAMMDDLSTSTSNAGTQVSGIDGALATLKSKGVDLTTTGVGGLLGTMLGIGDNAGTAEEKSEKLKSGLWQFAGGIFAKTLLMAVMGTTFGTVGKKAEDAQEPIEGLKGKISDISSTVTDTAKDMKTESENIPKGMAEGMTSDASLLSLQQAAQTMSNEITGGVAMYMAMKSPSKVMSDMGENVTLGLAQGIGLRAADVIAAITGILSDMKSKISAELTNFQNHGAALAQMFKNGLTSISLSDVPGKLFGTMKFSGVNTDMYNAGASATRSFANGLYSTKIKTPHLTFSTWVTGSGTNLTTNWSSNIQWYAKGGFPNLGDLFFAGERGPEMVGRMGNRNVVANNMQIAEGIRAAVVEGMMEVAMSGAFGGSSDSTPFVLNATIKTQDDEVLARVVERGQARRNARYNPVAQY